MKTKDVEVEIDGKKEVITIKRLNFGDMNDINQEATEIKVTGNVPIVKVNQKILKEKSLLKGIIKAPFTIDLNHIQNLDSETGNQLWEEFSILNQQSPSTK
jgi:hypothetical protein